jgi:hypothetical protein
MLRTYPFQIQIEVIYTFFDDESALLAEISCVQNLTLSASRFSVEMKTKQLYILNFEDFLNDKCNG